MNKKILIRDVTLRDGQQSLFATRMTQKQVDSVLPLFKEANFYAMEVWGGAVPDSVMRYLNENPWTRLEKIKDGIGDVSKLTALSRGRNLFGYNPYPEEAIEGFNRNAIKSGIGIMRIFDALNDVDNMKSTIKYVKENGGLADCTICYTIDPKFSKKEKLKALSQVKRLPHNIFTIDYFIKKAKELEKLGADIITIKDMAGLIPPVKSGQIVRRLKKELKIPINFHTHCTPGFGLAATLMAMMNGVDIIDTAILNFSSGSAAPAFEILQLFAFKLGIDTGINLEAVSKINKKLKHIRKELSDYDNYEFPIDFDIKNYVLPVEINKHFDDAIEYAKTEKEEKLLESLHEIDKYFNLPEPNLNVKDAEIPGGMYTNMLAQLKQLKLDHLLNRVLELVPLVRVKAGCPPLVTPTSQIVGVQAVNCAIDETKGEPFYSNTSVQFVNLVKGQYGKTPIAVDEDFREKICGHREEIPYDTSNYKKQENTVFAEFDNEKLAKNEKEELLLELFPSVAKNFLKNQIEKRYSAKLQKKEDEKLQKLMDAKNDYNKLSDTEKQERLMHGLYNYDWGIFEGE